MRWNDRKTQISLSNREEKSAETKHFVVLKLV